MQTWRVVDHQTYGLPVAAFAYPDDWQATSGVEWDFTRSACPCSWWATAWGGWEAFDVPPPLSFYWLEPNCPIEGQESRGQRAARPLPFVEAMQRWVLPVLRSYVEELKVLRCGARPELAQGEPGAFGGFVRVQYRHAGQWLEEEFEGRLVTRRAPGAYDVQTNWGFERLTACRAPLGQLEARLPFFQDLRRSLVLNPQWLEHYLRRVERVQADLQRLVSQQTLAAREAEVRAAQMQLEYIRHSGALSQRMADFRWYVDERVQQGRGDVLTGQRGYQDPYYGVSQHPYWDYIWSDGMGNYRYTNDPLFDPRQHLSGDWSLLQPAP